MSNRLQIFGERYLCREGLHMLRAEKRHFEQAPRVDRPPPALCSPLASSLPLRGSVRPHTANHFAAVALRSSEVEKS
jgi:hypothetical protein